MTKFMQSHVVTNRGKNSMNALFFSILVTFCLATQKIYVLFGPSQAGKSSFVNSLAGQDLAVVSAGAGISQTTSCAEYLIERSDGNILILDVPGLGDNYRNATDEEIMEEIREKVMKHLQVLILETSTTDRKSIDGILIFEPLDNDYTQLRQTVSKAEILFGQGVYESSLVVFTKGDLGFRAPECVVALPSCSWESKGIDQEQHDANWISMRAKLAELKPYSVDQMEKVMEEINIIAEHACENQEQKYVKITVPVSRQVQTGTTRRSVTRQKAPVQKLKSETYKVEETYLDTPARTFEQLKAHIIKLHIQDQNEKVQREMRYGTFWTDRLNGAGSLCAQLCMNADSKQTMSELWASLAKMRAPGGYCCGPLAWDYINVVRNNAEWIRNTHHTINKFGCRVPVYATRKVEKTRQVPYMFVEEYEDWIEDPVFSVVNEMEERLEPAPRRPLNEFVDEAREAVAKRIREALTEAL